MNDKKAIVGTLVAATMLLAAMGCWFCWHCPSRFYESHELFWRQFAWNGVGLAVFAGAWAVGWRRLLGVNHERLKPPRLCILFRGENDKVQRSAQNQHPVTLKTCYKGF